jgi:hypothetical protein
LLVPPDSHKVRQEDFVSYRPSTFIPVSTLILIVSLQLVASNLLLDSSLRDKDEGTLLLDLVDGEMVGGIYLSGNRTMIGHKKVLLMIDIDTL